MGGDRVPGPLSRFIPSIEEYVEASRREALREVKSAQMGPDVKGPVLVNDYINGDRSTSRDDTLVDFPVPRGKPGGQKNRDKNGRYKSKPDPWDFEGPYQVSPLTWIREPKDLEAVK